MSDLLHLEDFHAGQLFDAGTHALDAGQIKAFASQYDPQPFHTDEDAAKETFFKGLAASGWHVACLTMKMMVENGPKVAGGQIGAGGEITWPQPTRPGDILHVTSEVLDVKPSRSRPDRGIVVLRTEARNQKGEVLYVFTCNMLAFRRPT